MENVVHSKNGVNVDQLVGTINAVKGDPDIAKFQFRAKTEWLDGGHCKTTFKGFYGAKAEDSSRSNPIVMEGDEPPVLLGQNQGVNAVEAVLHALGACLSVGFVYNAAARGIDVESLEFDISGNLDLHAFLGLSDNDRAGYDSVDVKYKTKTDASDQEVEELWRYVQKTSPVCDILKNPVKVNIAKA